jgi:hypothetical protein
MNETINDKIPKKVRNNRININKIANQFTFVSDVMYSVYFAKIMKDKV